MNRFNIRVYGLLTDERRRVLVSDEMIGGRFYTKFPGGGLEYGEGTRECLAREFFEETGLRVTVGDHIYTTDFFQPSAFHAGQQIISIYYWVQASSVQDLVTAQAENAFTPEQVAAGVDCEVFRWIEWEELTEDAVSLPIDKAVVKLVKQR